MTSYNKKLFLNSNLEDPINKLVFEIINIIKINHDYISAIDLIKKNNLKLEDLVSRTIRLDLEDFVILADKLIRKKWWNHLSIKPIRIISFNMNTNEVIYKIVDLIKHKNDFKEASQLMLSNDLTVSMICRNTYKLSQLELARLVDCVLEQE